MGKVGFSDLLRSRCQDDKAAVRKAALLVTKSITVIGRPVEEVLLETLSSACSEPLVTIPKVVAIMALSEACRISPDGSLVMNGFIPFLVWLLIMKQVSRRLRGFISGIGLG